MPPATNIIIIPDTTEIKIPAISFASKVLLDIFLKAMIMLAKNLFIRDLTLCILNFSGSILIPS